LLAVKEYSYSFWSKFSFTDPSRANLGILRTDYSGVAGVTEKDACRAAALSHGSRGLCQWLGPFN